MLYDAVEIEAIKLAAANMESMRLSGKKVVLESIVWLRQTYERTGEPEMLEKAVWHIYAYLGLGYPYEEGAEEFDLILRYLNMDREEVFPARRWIYKKVPVRRSAVRGLLGRWNPVLHNMKIQDVVDDIMDKVTNKTEGEYVYHCGKEIQQSAGKTLWEYTYKLYINEEEAIFHNLRTNRYSIFV